MKRRSLRKARQFPADAGEAAPALGCAGFRVCSNPFTIDLSPVTLPSGETVYTSSLEAGALGLGMLFDVTLIALADWIAAAKLQRILMWAGIGVLFVAATLSGSDPQKGNT